MSLFSLFITIFFILFSTEILSQTKNKWSQSLGLLSWNEAKIKCESLKMRLPTLLEMKDAFREGEFEKWDNDEGGVYWTSTDAINQNDGTHMPEMASTYTKDGNEAREIKNYIESNSNSTLIHKYINARCIKANFKRKIRKSGYTWSEYQGEMNLESAKTACAKLKMKLPSIKQFQAGMKAGELEKWQPKGSYWTLDLYKENKIQKPFSIFFDWSRLFESVSQTEDLNHVRCVK